MAIRVRISIGLRDHNGVSFGTLLQVSNRELQVSTPVVYDPGQELEFQFPLEGYRASALGRATVRRVTAAETGLGPASYLLGIVDLDERCQAVFQEWLYDQAHGGGTPSSPHERLASSINSTISDASERGREGQRRLEALDAARARRDPNSNVSSHPSAASDSRRGWGRAALREALRRGEGPRSGERRAEEPHSEEHRGEREPLSSSAPVSGAAPRKEAPRGPSNLPVEVRLAEGAKPAKLLVRFHDRRRFLDMYRDHLDRDVLFVRCDGATLAVGDPLAVRLASPGGDVLLCDGLTLAVLPSGVAVRLLLADEERSAMRVAVESCRLALARSR